MVSSHDPMSPDAAHGVVDRATWRERVERELGNASFDRALVTRTPEGIDLQPLYTADDAPPAAAAGFPGQAPYVRGAAPLGSDAGRWRTCPRYDEVDPGDVAPALTADVRGGCDAVWLRPGGARRPVLWSGGDLARALGGLEGDLPALVVDAGGEVDAVVDAALDGLGRLGLEPAAVSIAFRADPLGALAAVGHLERPLDEAGAAAARLLSRCRQELPGSRALAITTLPYHEAGCTATQELAYAMATGVQHLRWIDAAGLALDAVEGQIELCVAAGRDLFTSIAKLRAARLLWGRVMAACGVGAAGALPIHAVTSTRTLTRRDPWVNALRVTSQTFAAAVGGAERITAAPYDEALRAAAGRGPSAAGRRLARNTAHVLREESHLAHVIDPAGGSWAVEWLTDRLARRAWDVFREIEQDGGMAACLRSGVIQRQVGRAAEAWRTRLARREAPITGVSEFPSPSEVVEPPVVPEDGGDDGVSDGGGEVVERLDPQRDAELFEELRDVVDAHAAALARPRVFLANLGRLAQHTARAAFARNLFAIAGLDVVDDPGTGDADPRAAAAQLGRRAEASGAAVACICGTDDQVAEAAVDVARALRGAGVVHLWLAGRPGDREREWRDAGIESFIHAGCDVHALLTTLLADLEVRR